MMHLTKMRDHGRQSSAFCVDEAIKVSLRELEVHELVEANNLLPLSHPYVQDPRTAHAFRSIGRVHVGQVVYVAEVALAVV